MKLIEDPAVADALGPITLGVIGDFTAPPEMVTKTGDWHFCRGCNDSWTETRSADAIGAVLWPGWFA